jgi:enoyl-CoA hydratase
MEFLKYEKITDDKNNALGILTISRPESLNALNSGVLNELDQTLNALNEKKDIRALIITGAGEKAFVAGADIKEIDTLDAKTAAEFAKHGQDVFLKIENLFCPVIAAVNGFALGGGLELALACDFIIASNTAKLGLPESTLGLIPGFGGTVRLARRVGPGLAKQWTFSGEMVTAQRAWETGLANQLCEPAQLIEETKKIASLMAQRSPQSLMMIKKSINETYGVASAKAMETERNYFAGLFGSADQKEGTKAFIEKRKPQFNNLG